MMELVRCPVGGMFCPGELVSFGCMPRFVPPFCGITPTAISLHCSYCSLLPASQGAKPSLGPASTLYIPVVMACNGLGLFVTFRLCLRFLTTLPEAGLPSVNLEPACETDPRFPATELDSRTPLPKHG